MAQECQASGRMSMKFFPGCNLSCSSRDLADLSDHMSRFRISLAVTVFLTVTSGCAGYAPAASPVVPDPALARGIASADSLIGAAVGTLIPGAVFVVSRNGRIVHERAFGYSQLNDYEGRRVAEPVERDERTAPRDLGVVGMIGIG